MSWNIEILVIEPKIKKHCDIGLIDVSELKESNIPFWDASSATNGPGISIADVNEKTVMIDANCRLSNAIPSILNDVKDRKMVLVRIADSEMCKIYLNGKEKKQGVLASLLVNKSDNGELDGEQKAWVYLSDNCGLSIDDSGFNLNDAKFDYYELD